MTSFQIDSPYTPVDEWCWSIFGDLCYM